MRIGKVITLNGFQRIHIKAEQENTVTGKTVSLIVKEIESDVENL